MDIKAKQAPFFIGKNCMDFNFLQTYSGLITRMLSQYYLINILLKFKKLKNLMRY